MFDADCNIMFLEMYVLFAAMSSPAAFAHWYLFVCFHLKEILARNSSQNGENQVLGALRSRCGVPKTYPGGRLSGARPEKVERVHKN